MKIDFISALAKPWPTSKRFIDYTYVISWILTFDRFIGRSFFVGCTTDSEINNTIHFVDSKYRTCISEIHVRPRVLDTADVGIRCAPVRLAIRVRHGEFSSFVFYF
jgi:hypothetical protein